MPFTIPDYHPLRRWATTKVESWCPICSCAKRRSTTRISYRGWQQFHEGAESLCGCSQAQQPFRNHGHHQQNSEGGGPEAFHRAHGQATWTHGGAKSVAISQCERNLARCQGLRKDQKGHAKKVEPAFDIVTIKNTQNYCSKPYMYE